MLVVLRINKIRSEHRVKTDASDFDIIIFENVEIIFKIMSYEAKFSDFQSAVSNVLGYILKRAQRCMEYRTLLAL